MDKTDRDISGILQHAYELAYEGNDRREHGGEIRKSTFMAACGRMPRMRDARTRATMWQLAHERGYLRQAYKPLDLNGAVILFSGDRAIDWERAQVRDDIWNREGIVEEPLEQALDMIRRPAGCEEVSE